MKQDIKFGTDGWRAIIAKDYTVENVARVAEATAVWLIASENYSSVVIGFDPRFGGKLFAETSCKVFLHYGIKVWLCPDIASTPMISLGTLKKAASLGIVITASHNPPAYNGFKLKGAYGGPLLPEKIDEIEKLIQDQCSVNLDTINLNEEKDKGTLEHIDLEALYLNQVETHFDLELIRRSGLKVAYDAMFGAGQQIMKRILPDAEFLHCENNPSFEGQAPEPIHKNLKALSSLLLKGGFDCGIATDGDADRIGLYDSQGNFIDSHHLILLLINYLSQVKGLSGKVVTAFSVSPKIGKLCSHFGIQHEITRIGFKYIAGRMIKEDVLLGGEESGGIAIKGHIPERDGIWIGLTILEYMAKTGKSLQVLIDEVYSIVGSFAFERSDLHLQEEVKNQIVRKCEVLAYTQFGNFKVQRTETVDGYKYFFNDDDWFMIRASGTEAVLRNYAQSDTQENAFAILKAAEETLLNPEEAKQNSYSLKSTT
jgi:phosphomannomutase